jgi:hypothetical protein
LATDSTPSSNSLSLADRPDEDRPDPAPLPDADRMLLPPFFEGDFEGDGAFLELPNTMSSGIYNHLQLWGMHHGTEQPYEGIANRPPRTHQSSWGGRA